MKRSWIFVVGITVSAATVGFLVLTFIRIYSASLKSTLIEAARKGDVQTVRDMLRRGANPNSRIIGGKSAIELAQERGHSDVEAILRRAAVRK